jgi:hypothetical protein
MLRFKMIWTVVGLMATAAVCLANPVATGPRAVIGEPVFTFQPVLEGTTVAHTFVMKNEGDAPLNILRINSG